MKENPVLEKSFAFALRIIKLNRYLIEEKKEFVLSKELLVSGTHIGKHIKEAVDGELQDNWYVEAGFGPCDGILPHPIFRSQVEAERWVSERLGRR